MRFDRLVTPAVQRTMLEVSRDFRREPQATEALLWEALRGRRLRGYKFRRQQPIGSFIVDFYCDEAALIVEVDGPIHAHQKQADAVRQQILEHLGLRMLRVPAEEVARNLANVLQLIERALEQHPLPLSLGERGQG